MSIYIFDIERVDYEDIKHIYTCEYCWKEWIGFAGFLKLQEHECQPYLPGLKP